MIMLFGRVRGCLVVVDACVVVLFVFRVGVFWRVCVFVCFG